MSSNFHFPCARNLKGLRRAALTVVLLATGASAAMGCDKPSFSGVIPDGSTASEEEMASAQLSVHQFVTDSEAYLACINSDRNARQLRNQAIDEMEQLAARFNRELRKFRGR